MNAIYLKFKNEVRFLRLKLIGDLGWKKIIGDKDIVPSFPSKKVLLATSFGGEPTITSVESLLGASLLVRNAEVEVLLCDGLKACQLCYYSRFPSTSSFLEDGLSKRFCSSCFNSGHTIFKSLNLEVLGLNSFLSDEDLKSIESEENKINEENYASYYFDGVNVGEQALAGARRFFAKANITDEPQFFEVIKKYLMASIKVARGINNLLNARSYDVIVFNHGIYVPQGIITRVAQRRNIRTVNWNTAYRKNTFIFSHGDTYHHTLISEEDTWSGLDNSEVISKKVVEYIKSRSFGHEDWITFNKARNIEDSDVYNRLNLDKSRPVIGLLTNVAWDAQLHYPANAFPDMIDWVLTTVSYFAENKHLQLVIRVHPAELTGNLVSRQLVKKEIDKHYPALPDNIRIIDSSSNFNSYSAMSICDSILIYGTKMGVELSALGKRVIVAGEAWIRNKGITRDIVSKVDYFNVLNCLPINNDLDEQELVLARKYAFHFFYRRMIPIANFRSLGGNYNFQLDINDLSSLHPGRDKGLDIICNGILNDHPFVYPAENDI